MDPCFVAYTLSQIEPRHAYSDIAELVLRYLHDIVSHGLRYYCDWRDMLMPSEPEGL